MVIYLSCPSTSPAWRFHTISGAHDHVNHLLQRFDCAIINYAPRISEPEQGRKVVFNGIDNESGMKNNLHNSVAVHYF